MQMEITAPAGSTFGPVEGWGQLSLSPDGRQIAFIASDIDGKRRLWVRSLASGAAVPLPGTENVGVVSVWSPDSRWVGFNANRKFQKIEVLGGSAPQVICECVAGTAAWNTEGAIFFASRDQPLQVVRASGGKPTPVFGFDVSRGETWQGSPTFLPDEKHFIYDSFASERGPVLASADGATRRFLTPIDGVARYVPNPSGGGWLVYVINEQLFVRPFSSDKGQFTGDRVFLSDSVLGGPSFSVSRNGLIAFRHTENKRSSQT
jgi:hypothetical protein